MKLFLVCCTIFFPTSWLTSLCYIHLAKHGFGAGDMPAIMFWGIPGGVVACAVLSSAIPFLLRQRPLFKYAGLMCLALGTALLAPVSLLLLGPWSALLSIAPLPGTLAGCFTVVGALGWSGEMSSLRRGLVSMVLMGMFSLGFALGLEPLIIKTRSIVFGAEDIRVISTRMPAVMNMRVDRQSLIQQYCPGGMQPAAVADFKPFEYKPGTVPEPRPDPMGFCHERILPVLLDFHERYNIALPLSSSGATGLLNRYPSESQIILVFQDTYRLPTPTVKLPLPDHAAVIYIQNGSEWTLFPPNARVSSRHLVLSAMGVEPNPYGETSTLLMMAEDVGGAPAGFQGPVAPAGTRIIAADPPR